jgi:hypothetical protein
LDNIIRQYAGTTGISTPRTAGGPREFGYDNHVVVLSKAGIGKCSVTITDLDNPENVIEKELKTGWSDMCGIETNAGKRGFFVAPTYYTYDGVPSKDVKSFTWNVGKWICPGHITSQMVSPACEIHKCSCIKHGWLHVPIYIPPKGAYLELQQQDDRIMVVIITSYNVTIELYEEAGLMLCATIPYKHHDYLRFNLMGNRVVVTDKEKRFVVTAV